MITIDSYGIIPLKQEKEHWKVLLILHREGNHWGFPKGRAEAGENSLEAATRELKEETGLDVTKVLTPDPLIEKYQFRRKQKHILKTVHYFAACVSGEMHLQEKEIRDAKWIDLTEAASHLTFKEAQNICQQVIDYLYGKGK